MLSIESIMRYIVTEVFALVLMAVLFRKPLLQEKKNVPLKILLAFLALYLAQLFYVLLTPSYFYRRFSFSVERVSLIPFRALREWLAHPFNFFGNVLLFMPIGYFEVLLHPTKSRGKQLAMTAANAAGISLFVELAQCFVYRVSDVDDVILNTLGGVLGALICMLLQRIGFQRTRVGSVLLPRIPRAWQHHMHLNRFCVILVATMEVVLFTTNYIVTIPKPKVRDYHPAQAETIMLDEKASAAVPSQTPEPDSRQPTEAPKEPSVTPEPTATPRVYHTDQLALEGENILLVRLADNEESATVVYAADSREKIYPASTLKMLTALTVLDIARPEDTVEVGAEIYIPPLDASRAGLEYGMTLTIRDLLEGLLLPSGADAAYALGVYCGRKLAGDDSLSYEDAVHTFVDAMNQKAAAIGAKDTTAINVVGYDAKGQLSTAEDILRIAKVFLDQPVLAEICSIANDSITSEEGKSVSLSNTNKMLHTNSPYYNGKIAGVKTGTTSKAGNCLVSVFTVDGDRYICIVMNSSYYGKFEDTQKLYDAVAMD